MTCFCMCLQIIPNSKSVIKRLEIYIVSYIIMFIKYIHFSQCIWLIFSLPGPPHIWQKKLFLQTVWFKELVNTLNLMNIGRSNAHRFILRICVVFGSIHHQRTLVHVFMKTSEKSWLLKLDLSFYLINFSASLLLSGEKHNWAKK